MEHRELQLPGCQDASPRGQAWLPESAPGAVIVVSHGVAEHGGRYEAIGSRPVEQGNAVYAIDHRGHGLSSGRRANIDRFDYLVSDLGTFVGRAQREHPDTPVILLGHSMGGANALACALKLPATAVSRNPAVVSAYESDPLVHHGAIPARTLAELSRSC